MNMLNCKNIVNELNKNMGDNESNTIEYRFCVKEIGAYKPIIFICIEDVPLWSQHNPKVFRSESDLYVYCVAKFNDIINAFVDISISLRENPPNLK